MRRLTDISSTNAPPWLEEMVREACDLLGVGPEWSLILRVEDHLEDASDDVSATCNFHPMYLNATVSFDRESTVKGGRVAREIVLHEIIHIALAEIDYTVDCMIDAAPKKLRKVLRSAYVAATERSAQRMSRALVRNTQERKDERREAE